MDCRCRFRKEIRESGIRPLANRSIYLDYNATTPVDPAVMGALDRACRRSWGNPSSLHGAGSQAWEILEESRAQVASCFGWNPDELHFCSGGTEALGSAIQGLIDRQAKRTYITSVTEHDAVRRPLTHARRGGENVVFLGVDGEGKINLDELNSVISETGLSPVLILSPVNHETGALQPVKEAAELVHGAEGLVLLDGVQAAVRLDPEAWAPHGDLAAVAGHKLYAPKGVGLLYKRRGVRLRPRRFGGSQEGGLFPGTENIPGIAAFGAAAAILQKNRRDEHQMLATLTREGLGILENSGIEFYNESPVDAVPGILCLSFPWVENMETFLHSLNKRQIFLSRFSACTDGVVGESRILKAMGVPLKRAEHSIRISFGRWNRRDDFFQLAKALKEIYKESDQ